VGGPLEDTELVGRARRGEVSAYEELVRRYQGIAHRTAYVITRQAAEAEDAAQQAFVKAYRALDRFDRERPFRPWLLRIVANEARNLRRSAGRRSSLELAVASEPEELAPSPEQEAVSRERREALLRAMGGLTEAEREVIALRYFLDLSETEMAEVMAVARGTVKSRLSRALRRLRNAAVEAGVGVEVGGD
jgi:RNA polymerase sigma factor (sigma-70 family)